VVGDTAEGALEFHGKDTIEFKHGEESEMNALYRSIYG